jgi:hypothetical protein
MIRRMVAHAVFFLAFSTAWAGEIIFVDPVQEKAKGLPPVDSRARTQQSLERTLESARERAGRGRVAETIYLDDAENNVTEPPAAERARSARDYLDDSRHAPPTIILKSGQPPTDAAKARQSARSWVAQPPSKISSDRCKTENIVGGIEGQPQGQTVIQSSKGGVTVCK